MLVPPPPGDGAGSLASGAGSSAAAATDAADAAELPNAMPLHAVGSSRSRSPSREEAKLHGANGWMERGGQEDWARQVWGDAY